MDRLETGTNQIFKFVFDRLDNLEEVVINQKKPKKIGLKDS